MRATAVTARIVSIAMTLCGAILPGLAFAHDARPLSIAIVEQTDGVYRSVIRVPPTVETANTPSIIWPAHCSGSETTAATLAGSRTLLVSCPGGLGRYTIRIEYPYYNPSITTLIRMQAIDSPPITAVLPPDELVWRVPEAPTFWSVAADYLALGIRHIWEGIDHLLFVAGLLLLARRPGRIVWAITGFTLAHSMTLSLAALDLVRPAVAPVEAMIALSIVFLAVEVARNDATSFSHKFPIALSFVFGLLHGFGFASALGEIGLPPTELVAGLLFFNLGVEAGQLSFIAVVVALVLVLRRLLPAGTLRDNSYHAIATTGAYCLGIPASFWFVQRTAAAFGV